MVIKRKKMLLFDGNIIVPTMKDVFHRNEAHKQRFVYFLGETLAVVGCSLFMQDADTLIVANVVMSAKEKKTVLVGDDTNFLVLLIHHVKESDNQINLFCPRVKAWIKKRTKNLVSVSSKGNFPVEAGGEFYSYTLSQDVTRSQEFME